MVTAEVVVSAKVEGFSSLAEAVLITTTTTILVGLIAIGLQLGVWLFLKKLRQMMPTMHVRHWMVNLVTKFNWVDRQWTGKSAALSATLSLGIG